MGWKASAGFLTLSFIGLGSLVYFLFFKDDEKDDSFLFSSSENTSIEIKVPKDIVGSIIGRGGQTLRDIETKTNTTIKVKEDDFSDEFKVCVVKGTYEATQHAECLIHEIIVSQPLIETYEMYVPEFACGRLIGKGGENIRMICRSSNSKLVLEKAPASPTSMERKLIIKGTPEQIALAKLLVGQKLEEEINFRNTVEVQVSTRPPRTRPKYLLPAQGQEEDTPLNGQKEQLVSTNSNGLLEVYVSALESPDRLWVQKMGPSTVDLDRLNEEMSNYYVVQENKELHRLKEVKCGQIVAAPFVYDDKWYRAEVVEVQNPWEADKTCVKLYYVDYGDNFCCKMENVYELRTDFLRLRFQALECKLAKIKPKGPTWTEDAIDLTEDLTHVALWRPLMAKIHCYRERPTRAKREKSPVPCIELFDTQGDSTINVGEELVNNGFAEWEEETVEPSESLKEHSELLWEHSESLWDPSESLKEPLESLKEPSESLKEPLESLKEPSESLKEPSESLKEPSESLKEPSESLKEPSESLKEPSESLKKPSESLKEPSESLSEPSEALKEPSESLKEA